MKIFDAKTIEALRWIVSILDKNKVEYQISGGFAAKLYDSSRELNDIDFEISEKYFPKILPEISQYIIYGPERFKDAKWDCYRVTLDYFGQKIDITGADTLRMSNKERTKWITYDNYVFDSLDANVEDVNIKVISPQELIDYKKELDGDHQLEDIRAINKYLVTPRDICR